MSSERGIGTRSGVPDMIMRRIQDAVAQTLDDPTFQAKAKQLSQSLAYLPGDDWAARMRARKAELKKMWDATPWVQ